MDMTSVFAEIIKSTPQDDGSLLVYGKATGSDLDLDQQRCDPEWLRTAMPEWLKIGNIREQHDSKRAVGKAFEHEVTDDGSHMIRARVVDPIAKAKVEAGILTGFSIGIRAPRVSKSADAKNGTIVGGQVVEVSLVDRPCLPTATLMVCKAATVGWEGSPLDLDEDLGLVKCEELILDAAEEIVEKAADVDHLEAPAPGQVCVVCNEDGHLTCGEKAADVEVPAEDVEKTAEVEVPAGAEGVAPTDAEKATDVVEPEFDREAAIALVKSAADGLGQDESGDISGADQAIALIAQLVISEAQDLAKMPAQGCDIHLLMSAVDALRCFSKREQIEQGGVDPDDMVLLAAEMDVEKAEAVEKAKYTAEELRQMLADGKAMKNADGDPSYPIGDVEDLENAIHAVGRGKGDHDVIRSYIKGRAKALGKSDLIPDGWNTSKAADVEEATVPDIIDPALAGLDESAVKSLINKGVGDFLRNLIAALSDVADEEDAETGKAQEPDLAKSEAAAFEGALLKAIARAIGETDTNLNKSVKAVVEAETESTKKSVSDLTEEVEKVKSMATPGGPALRRTQVERDQSRRSDLMVERNRFKALASNTEDPDLRKGYGAKAAQLEAEIKAL